MTLLDRILIEIGLGALVVMAVATYLLGAQLR